MIGWRLSQLKKILILVHGGKVLGYSEDKKIIKSFIDTYKIEDYRIEKIKKIPEDIEYDYQTKEIYFDHHYDTYVTEDLLTDISDVCESLSTMFIGVENTLRESLEYIKLEPEERDKIMKLQQHLYDLINMLVGIDSFSGPNAFYDDYFDTKQLITEMLHKNIVIYGGD